MNSGGIFQKFLRQKYKRRFHFNQFKQPVGKKFISSADPLEEFLKTVLDGHQIFSFSDFEVPVLIQANDLLSNRPAYFTSAGDFPRTADLRDPDRIPLCAALRGALSLPGVLPPRQLDHMILTGTDVKSGFKNWPLKCMGADKTILIQTDRQLQRRAEEEMIPITVCDGTFRKRSAPWHLDFPGGRIALHKKRDPYLEYAHQLMLKEQTRILSALYF